MSRKNLNLLANFIVFFILTFSFQNCSNTGFEANDFSMMSAGSEANQIDVPADGGGDEPGDLPLPPPAPNVDPIKIYWVEQPDSETYKLQNNYEVAVDESPEDSQFQCRFLADEFSDCSPSGLLVAPDEGTYSFEIRLVSALDETISSLTSQWVVNRQDTSISLVKSNNPFSSIANFTFNVVPMGTVGEIRCRLNAGDYKSCVNSVNYRGLSPGEHSIQLMVVNDGGVSFESEVFNFTQSVVDVQNTANPSWLPAAGTIYQGSSKLSDVDPCPMMSCPYYAKTNNTGQNAVIYNWTGATASSDRYYVIAQGGHSGYGGNEAYELGPFNTNTPPMFNRVIEPSWDVNYMGELNFDGTPASRHGYNTTLYVPQAGSAGNWVGLFGASAVYGTGNEGSSILNGVSFAGVPRYLPYNTFSDVPSQGPSFYTSMDYDPVTQKVWRFGKGASGGYALTSYHVPTNNWVTEQSGGQAILTNYGASAIDPERRILVHYNANASGSYVLVFDLDNSTAPNYLYGENYISGPLVANVNEGSHVASTASGFEFDPIAKSFVAWKSGTSLWEIQVPTNFRSPDGAINKDAIYSWQEVPFTGPNPSEHFQSAVPIYNKFQYISSIDAFVVLTDRQNGFFVWKRVRD